MAITHEALTELLEKAFPNGDITCTPLANDNDHWKVIPNEITELER